MLGGFVKSKFLFFVNKPSPPQAAGASIQNLTVLAWFQHSYFSPYDNIESMIAKRLWKITAALIDKVSNGVDVTPLSR